ncbi:HU family DNA-binding protein [bacterium]|nr:MAG: HU family DNA-binding protein [bacterium]
MTKALTKSPLSDSIAEKTGVTKKVAAEMTDALVQLACEEAKNSFTLPGIGKLIFVNRKLRTGRDAKTDEYVEIHAKKSVKFRVAKACKEGVNA